METAFSSRHQPLPNLAAATLSFSRCIVRSGGRGWRLRGATVRATDVDATSTHRRVTARSPRPPASALQALAHPVLPPHPPARSTPAAVSLLDLATTNMALLTRNIARSCAKPVAGRTPCVALRPRSLVMVRAEPDLSGLAKQAISMGVDALKNVDKDQVRGPCCFCLQCASDRGACPRCMHVSPYACVTKQC